jgi:hypothetical protein
MKIKNSFPKENDIIDNIRISKGKSVEKKIRKSSENNLDYSNYKYLDDTNIKIQNNYYCISNDLEKSIEKEDTTSKDSKDNTLSGESLYTLSNFSLSFLVNEKKKFKNLKIEEKISEKILKKKKI